MVTLSSVAEILNGDRSTNYPSGNDFVAFGFPFINAGHLKNGEIDFSNMDYISEDKYRRLSGAKIRKNDILLCLRGSLGKYAVSNIDEGAPASSIAVIRPNERVINSKFLTCVISSFIFQKQIDLANNGSSQPNLSASSVSDFLIPTPSLDEQEQIAEALSDVDRMISSLEKLIAKKKAVKQGAMQELLTGKKRLPRFTGEWRNCVIGAMGDFYSGLSGKSKKDFDCGDAQFITFLNVLLNVKIDTSILASVNVKENESQNAVQKGDLFFNSSSETPEEVGMCAVLDEELENTYLNSFCFGFRLNDDAHNPLFLSYYLNSSIGRKIMSVLAQGATRYNLSKNNFAETIIKLPAKEEQTAIASILSDMDNEMEALEQKLAKTRHIKQGMMQQLLTGKIRLV